jgi:hypothetical protein
MEVRAESAARVPQPFGLSGHLGPCSLDLRADLQEE